MRGRKRSGRDGQPCCRCDPITPRIRKTKRQRAGRTTGEGFDLKRICPRARTIRDSTPRRTLYPVYREKRSNGKEGQTKKTRAYTREGLPPPDPGRAVHRDTVVRAAAFPTLITVAGKGAHPRSPKPPAAAGDRRRKCIFYLSPPCWKQICGNCSNPPATPRKSPQILVFGAGARGAGKISAGSAAGDRRATPRKFSLNSKAGDSIGGSIPTKQTPI